MTGFVKRFDGKWLGKIWAPFWQTASTQLQHVEWTGCTAWDLIQPSFMFMVGVAMPYSFASRAARGDSWGKQFLHALIRSLTLIALGIFLRSTHSDMTNFTFEDVLTQIGLGYLFVFILMRAPFIAQLVAMAAILGGYWFFFFHYPLPPPQGDLVTRYMTDVRAMKPEAWNQFSGLACALEQAHKRGGRFRSQVSQFLSPLWPGLGRQEILDQQRRLSDAQFCALDGNHAVRRDGRPIDPQPADFAAQAGNPDRRGAALLCRLDGDRHDDLARAFRQTDLLIRADRQTDLDPLVGRLQCRLGVLVLALSIGSSTCAGIAGWDCRWRLWA